LRLNGAVLSDVCDRIGSGLVNFNLVWCVKNWYSPGKHRKFE